MMERKTIGQFIAALRKANGMTQQEVADRLHVSNKAVSRWEREECAPDLSLIPALAELFGVTCDELLKGERIPHTLPTEKSEPKVERQLKALVNRAVSGFQTLICISLALSAVGLICMFGISYGFYRPVIGFAVMLLFAAAAALLAAIAVNRLKAVRTDNELFEHADAALLEKFHASLGQLSFAAFFAVLSVVLLSLPLVLVRSDYVVKSVLMPAGYLRYFVPVILLLLIAVYWLARERYIAWITGQPYASRAAAAPPEVRRMTLLQVGMILLAGVLFAVAPFWAGGDPHQVETVLIGLNMTGLALLAGNIACFAVFLLRYKSCRKELLLPGIRNMLLIPSGFLLTQFHTVAFSRDDWGYTAATVWQREDYWHPEQLLYGIGWAVLVVLLFWLIDRLRSGRSGE